MSYNYEAIKPELATAGGLHRFLKVRDVVQMLLKTSKAFRADAAMVGYTGDSWFFLACLDRMVEIGELVQVPNPVSNAGQHQLYISGRGGR